MKIIINKYDASQHLAYERLGHLKLLCEKAKYKITDNHNGVAGEFWIIDETIAYENLTEIELDHLSIIKNSIVRLQNSTIN
jgi:hypothetical protein